jgi:hypothetical protein
MTMWEVASGAVLPVSGSSLFSVEPAWLVCYGFVTGQTSISLPFYRDVTGVTAPTLTLTLSPTRPTI